MRANGASLSKCINKPVSVIGTVQMVHPDSQGFNITTSDSYNVSVKLQRPLTDNVSGLVEIHGVAQGPATVACDYYISFPPSLASTYESSVDNEAVNLGFLVSNAWQ
ncbi:hypothetical protein V9T40_012319 [Parthenolecanium corni]|uniref:Uncharacterized protein n=1 Tax=Parthenolecanium corni TaxID=536013 RepID=A0AAN9Y0E8_9HEMI